MIQQSINQMLTSVGVFGRFNPELDKKRELKSIARKEDVLKQQLDTAQKAAVEYDIENSPDGKINPEVEARQLENVSSIYGAQYENYKKRFNLDPTVENYKQMASAQTQQAEMRKMANKIAMEKVSNAVSQDNDFKKHRESILLGSDAKPLKVEV